MLLRKSADYAKRLYPITSSGVPITSLTTDMQNYLNIIKGLDEAYGFDLDVDAQEIFYLDIDGNEMPESRITVDELINIITPK
jgi:hypothetical protein